MMKTHNSLGGNYKITIFRTLTSVKINALQVTINYKLGFVVEKDAEVLNEFFGQKETLL
jgi:hypothetical protein